MVGTTVKVMAARHDGSEFPVELSLARREHRAGAIYTAVIRDVTERTALLAELHRRANSDDLTGLASRSHFTDLVGEAATATDGGAVLLVTIDGFQVINSSLGYEVGDAVLVEVARRLEQLAAPDGRVCRYGGDEFALLLTSVADMAEARSVAAAINRQVLGALPALGRSVTLTASIGLAGIRPGSDPVEVLREAAEAAHQAKAGGRGRVELFDDDLRARARLRLDVEIGLRRAIGDGELVLHYQPVVDLRTGRIAGAEALVRWEHPELSLLGPAHFIDVAEASGLIQPLGAWALDAALQERRCWQSTKVVDDDFVMAVNLSARQLAQVDLVAVVERALEESGCSPHHLCLEVTETSLMVDTPLAARTLRELARLGVRLAIDDFGTGYSTLAYLERFAADIVKVDRSFIGRIGSGGDAITTAVIGIATSLGMRTVAEGVETAEQLAGVRALGCDLAQGFFISRPVAAAVFGRLAATSPSW